MRHNLLQYSCFSILLFPEWCPITHYWSAIALQRVEWQHQFVSSYWVLANNNWYLAHVSQRHLSAIRELINRLAVCLRKGEEMCKICLWICSHPWCGKKKKAAFSPLYLNLASTVACLLLSTCSHSTRHWPYFLLIIMWIIKAQVHETHINHLQWARNGPGLSHCSQHKLRPKYSWCKLGILFPPAEFTVTCLSLKTCHLPGSQQGMDPSLPNRHGDHWLLLPSIGLTLMLHEQMTCYLFWKSHLLHLAIPTAALAFVPCLLWKRTVQNH